MEEEWFPYSLSIEIFTEGPIISDLNLNTAHVAYYAIFSFVSNYKTRKKNFLLIKVYLVSAR